MGRSHSKPSKGSRFNPIVGAYVINRGGGGGELIRRAKPTDRVTNRALSAAPKESRGWETVGYNEMSVGERKAILGANAPAGMFVGAPDRPDLIDPTASKSSLRSAMEREMAKPVEHSEHYLACQQAEREREEREAAAKAAVKRAKDDEANRAAIARWKEQAARRAAKDQLKAKP